MLTEEMKCPFCAETIKAESKICRFCNRDVSPSKVKSFVSWILLRVKSHFKILLAVIAIFGTCFFSPYLNSKFFLWGPQASMKSYIESNARERFHHIVPTPQITQEDIVTLYGGPNEVAGSRIQSMKVLDRLSKKKIKVKTTWVIGMDEEKGATEYILGKTKHGWKVFWPPSPPKLQKNQTALFLKRGRGLGIFRVSLDSYYNYNFRNKKSYYYSLKAHGVGYGYLSHNTDNAQQIYEKIEDGSSFLIKATIDYSGCTSDSCFYLRDIQPISYNLD